MKPKQKHKAVDIYTVNMDGSIANETYFANGAHEDFGTRDNNWHDLMEHEVFFRHFIIKVRPAVFVNTIFNRTETE